MSLLEIKDLHAGIDGNEILKGINLKIGPGEIHAIMGRNGSGKTTTANIIMGHPDFEVEKGDVLLEGESLLELESWERARKGVFLSFQYPQAVPGLQVGNFLRKSVAALTPSDTVLIPSISKPLSVSSRTASLGLRSINCRISKRFFSPPLKPSLTYLDMNDRGISRASIASVNPSLKEEPLASSSPLMLATDLRRKFPT